MDPDTLAAGLLHDVVEDTELDIEFIRGHFDETIANLVDGVTKLRKINEMGNAQDGIADAKAESLRKMFLAMVDDVRVVIIKLADRLHNMRTLGTPEEAQAEAHRPGDAGHLRAAGESSGHLADQVGAGGSELPLPGAKHVP